MSLNDLSLESSNRHEDSVRRLFALFSIAILYIYVVIYNPFISTSMVGNEQRITIEAITILLLAILNLEVRYVGRHVLWFILLIILCLPSMILEQHNVIDHVSLWTKIVVFILFIGVLQNSNIRNMVVANWLFFSKCICILALTTTILFHLDIIEFSSWTYSYGRLYLHHPILGNLTPTRMFGIELGKVTGYMLESNYLGYVIGYNIIVAHLWIPDDKRRKRFLILHYCAGMATLSTTFILFFLLYVVYQYVLSAPRLRNYLLYLIVVFFIGGAIYYSGILSFTSGAIRLLNFGIYIDLLRESTFQTFVFGHGIDHSIKTTGIGVDSGWISIILDRGLIYLVFIFALIYRHTRFLLPLFMFVTYYNFANPLFMTPIFWFLLALPYSENTFRSFNNREAFAYRY